MVIGARGVVVLLSIAVILVACSPANPTAPGAVIDDLGRSVNIEGIPQRIVSLDPSNTEILFALGLGDKVVGVTEYCDYPPEAKDKEKVGKTKPPDIEKIIALQPDLILAASYQAEDVIPTLEEMKFPVFALAPKNLDEVLKDIEAVGWLTGSDSKASKLVAELESRVKAITDEIERLEPEEKPRVFYICWTDPIYTGGRKTFIDDLIVRAGGENLFADIEGYKTVDVEAVIARDPEVIIASTMLGAGNAPEWVRSEPLLKNVAARRNERICEIDPHLIDRHGPRIVEGLEDVAKCIHPEIFGAP